MNNFDVIVGKNKYILLNSNIPAWISLTEEGYSIYKYFLKSGMSKTCQFFNISKNDLEDFRREIEETLYPKERAEKISNINASTVFLTDSCNFKCKHCFYSCGNNKIHTFLDFDNVYKKFIEDFVKEKGKFITFTGGEPLLNNRLKEFIEYAVDNDIQCMVLTNGSLLSEELCDFFKKNNVKIQISVDGNENTFSLMRQGGDFNKIVNSLELLGKYKIDYDISFTPCKINLESIRDVIDLAIRYSATAIHFPILENYGSANVNSDDLYISESMQEEFLGALIDEYYGNGLREKIRIENFESIANSLISGDKKISCGLGRTFGSLSAEGELYPCSEVIEKKYKLGKYTMERRYESSEVKKEDFIITVDSIEKCKICKFRYYCGGGCRLHAYLKYGVFAREDSDCKLLEFCYERVLLWIS